MHLQTQSARLDVAENDELSKPDKFVLKMKHFDTIGEQYPVTARRYRDDFHIEPAGFEISDDERHALIASLGTNLSPEAYNKEKQAFAAAVRFGQRQGLPLEDARALALEILRGGAPTSMTSSNDAVVTSPLMSSAGDHDVAMSLTRRPQLLSEMMADERAADKSGSIFRYATPERFRGKPVNALEQEVYTRTAGLRQPPKFKRSASMVSGMDDSSPVKQIADKASRPWYSYLNPFNWGGSRVAVSKMGLNGTSDERHLVDEENMGGV
jgi:hypothetical protein